jgi:peptidoglycan/LPS O-acetylase OafA/YrhL
MRESRIRFHGLQVLRAFAALFVVLYHADKQWAAEGATFLGGAFQAGYSGVDLFFVLSGFIITYTSAALIGRRGSALPFLLRRFNRVYPIYWLTLFLPLLLVFWIAPHMVPDPGAYEPSGIWKTFLLLFGHPQMSQVTWTLSHELYFYAFFALVIFVPRLRWLAALVLVLSAVAFVYRAGGQRPLKPWPALEGALSPYNLQFAGGVACALLYRRLSRRVALLTLVSGVAAFAAVAFLWARSDPATVRAARALAYGLPAAATVLGAAALEHHGARLGQRVLVLVGDASYVLYLVHAPLLRLGHRMAKAVGLPHGLATTSLVIVGIVVVSIAVHRLVERPLLRAVNRRLPKPPAATPRQALEPSRRW